MLSPFFHRSRMAIVSSSSLLVGRSFCSAILLLERHVDSSSLRTVYFSFLSDSSLPYTNQAIYTHHLF